MLGILLDTCWLHWQTAHLVIQTCPWEELDTSVELLDFLKITCSVRPEEEELLKASWVTSSATMIRVFIRSYIAQICS